MMCLISASWFFIYTFLGKQNTSEILNWLMQHTKFRSMLFNHTELSFNQNLLLIILHLTLLGSECVQWPMSLHLISYFYPHSSPGGAFHLPSLPLLLLAILLLRMSKNYYAGLHVHSFIPLPDTWELSNYCSIGEKVQF